jgi:hypothetical protein
MDGQAYQTLHVSELRWLVEQALWRGHQGVDLLHPSILDRLTSALERLVQFAEEAARHERGKSYRPLRDSTLDAFCVRIGGVARRPRVTRQIVALLWKKQSPRSWILHRMKESVPKSESSRPGVCELKLVRGHPAVKRAVHCGLACDLDFFRNRLELSFAEIGYVFELPKSTAEILVKRCTGRRDTSSEIDGIVLDPGQVAAMWDLLRGATTRTGIAAEFSWRTELRDFWRWLSLSWR